MKSNKLTIAAHKIVPKIKNNKIIFKFNNSIIKMIVSTKKMIQLFNKTINKIRILYLKFLIDFIISTIKFKNKITVKKIVKMKLLPNHQL